MSSVAVPTSLPPPYDKHWALGARIACLVCISLPWVKYGQSVINPCGDMPAQWIVVAVPWTALILYVLFNVGVRGRPRKLGLTWAAKTGLFSTAISLFMASVPLLAGETVSRLVWTYFALANGMLLMAAIKTYRSMEPGASIIRFLTEQLGQFLVCFALLMLWALKLTGEWGPAQGARRHDSAMAALGAIQSAEEQYSSRANEGFPASLKDLETQSGPIPPDTLAAGLPGGSIERAGKLGFTFTYATGPRDITGRITNYSISARSCCAGGFNYYSDESGVIRRTKESRPANARDDALPYPDGDKRGLRAIRAAEAQYASKYQQGFSSNLKVLGPPSGSAQTDASAARLIDRSLASGTKLGYIFNYSPGPPDGAGRITSYNVVVRFCCLGKYNNYSNYHMDETGDIQWMNERRPDGTGNPAPESLSPPGTNSDHQSDSAMAAFEKAIRFEPKRKVQPQARQAADEYQRGVALGQAGKGDEAIAAVEKAIQLDPKRLQYYKALDDLLSKRREWQKIITLWTQFIVLVPGNGQAYCERGGAYSYLHNLPLALKDGETACSLGYQECCEYMKKSRLLYPGGTTVPPAVTAPKQ
jgi:tetratricopeptide (TPR) repeat protein/type II secretory pathway pseudopilin PulG